MGVGDPEGMKSTGGSRRSRRETATKMSPLQGCVMLQKASSHRDDVIINYHPEGVTYLYKHGSILHITVSGNLPYGGECNELC